MTVLMVNTALGVRRRLDTIRDAAGYPMPVGYSEPVGPWPGRSRERGADAGWLLALDPAAWPVREGDIVTEPSTGTEWLVVRADLLRNNLDPTVDYIRAEGKQRTTTGHTEPGGAEFAAR